MPTVTLSTRGRIIIPKEFRERYNLKKGDKLHFIDYGGVISIVPASKDPIRSTEGMLKGEASLTDALLESRKQDKAKGK